MNTRKQSLIDLRNIALKAKVGSEIKCPSCLTMHTKKHYNSVFCKTKGGTVCKDNYWNNVDGKKRNNTTRISPANADYYENVILPKKEQRELDADEDLSWDAHKDTM